MLARGEEKTANGQRSPMKSLSKGLAALDLLAASDAVRTSELAAALSIDKGSASRLLQSLALAGYARRMDHGRYCLVEKPHARRRATRGRPPIRPRAKPLLQRIVTLSGESAHLAIQADDQVLYLDREVPDVMLRADRPVGTLAPLPATALGRALLAFGDAPLPDELRTDEFLAKIERYRSQGYTEDDEEFCVGVRCVAAPLRESDGEVVAAISISGPSVRVGAEDLHRLGKLIIDTAKLFAS